jgi:hypothetical protein
VRVTDIIRGVLDLVDRAESAPQEQPVAVQVAIAQPDVADDSELVRMKQIAGLLTDQHGEYSNTPVEKYAGIDAVTAAGDDVHKSKHPADIRTNAPSMYPNFQAKE